MLCIANKTTQFVKFKRYVEGVAHCNVLQFMVFAWFQSYLNNFYFGTKASTSRKTYIQFSFFLLQITTFFPHHFHSNPIFNECSKLLCNSCKNLLHKMAFKTNDIPMVSLLLFLLVFFLHSCVCVCVMSFLYVSCFLRQLHISWILSFDRVFCADVCNHNADLCIQFYK